MESAVSLGVLQSHGPKNFVLLLAFFPILPPAFGFGTKGGVLDLVEGLAGEFGVLALPESFAAAAEGIGVEPLLKPGDENEIICYDFFGDFVIHCADEFSKARSLGSEKIEKGLAGIVGGKKVLLNFGEFLQQSFLGGWRRLLFLLFDLLEVVRQDFFALKGDDLSALVAKRWFVAWLFTLAELGDSPTNKNTEYVAKKRGERFHSLIF